jgi:hypothetical protein
VSVSVQEFNARNSPPTGAATLIVAGVEQNYEPLPQLAAAAPEHDNHRVRPKNQRKPECLRVDCMKFVPTQGVFVSELVFCATTVSLLDTDD